MRLAVLLSIAVAAPALALDMPSKLADPFANAGACEAFAYGVETSARDPFLDAIAIMEARVAHVMHSDDAESATDLLNARADGTLKMADAAVAVYVRRVCRSL